jgi:hypothetical protein
MVEVERSPIASPPAGVQLPPVGAPTETVSEVGLLTVTQLEPSFGTGATLVLQPLSLKMVVVAEQVAPEGLPQVQSKQVRESITSSTVCGSVYVVNSPQVRFPPRMMQADWPGGTCAQTSLAPQPAPPTGEPHTVTSVAPLQSGRLGVPPDAVQLPPVVVGAAARADTSGRALCVTAVQPAPCDCAGGDTPVHPGDSQS